MTTPKRDGNTLGWITGLCVAVLWASAFPAIRVAAPELGVVGLTLGRLLIATATLVAIGAWRGARLPRAADLPLIISCGIVGMAAYQLLLNWGELYVPAGTTSMIVSASPIVSVTIAAWLLREKPSLMTMIGSAVAVSGVAVVCFARAGIALSSAVWIIVLAGLLLGIYIPLTRPLLSTYTGLEVAIYSTFSGTVITLLMTPWAWANMVSASGSAWLAAAYLGALPSALGYALWGYALSRLTVAATTSFLYLVPPIAVILSYVWLHETPMVSEGVGGVIVLLGVVLLNHGRLPRRRAQNIQPSIGQDEIVDPVASS
ncbi:DMT family transporter [Mycolicibacterium sp. lyk4-40-TYG-92]|uniref:DMT family transporter n=1 Tax=Mycolicibacterium sp. lyk4-40-TYG-92 TaxID=3040295 RepID=UPI00254F7AEB|nr:DMT family transporter [Mycolicibacterium sp. lyk4-40-TYG-92]